MTILAHEGDDVSYIIASVQDALEKAMETNVVLNEKSMPTLQHVKYIGDAYSTLAGAVNEEGFIFNSAAPSKSPSQFPTASLIPSVSPSNSPTVVLSLSPTHAPTHSSIPTSWPTFIDADGNFVIGGALHPSSSPSSDPSSIPSVSQRKSPSVLPFLLIWPRWRSRSFPDFTC